jgi:hypothetical protein
MEIAENVNDEIILIDEDPEGEYRRIPSWVAQEFDPSRRASILRALVRYNMEPDLYNDNYLREAA